MNNSNTPADFSQSQIHQNQSSGKISSLSQFYRFSLACGTTIALDAVEEAGLSYIPCTHEQPLFKFAHLWNSPTQINLDNFPDAHGWKMEKFQGVQIFTGTPTKRRRDGSVEYLTVLDVEVRLLERYPDLYQQIEQAYQHNIDGAPFVIQTKSGGRQFYCYVPNYHERKREFKDVRDNAMLLEFLSDKCLARIDDRYRIETGSLLNIPTLSKETLQSIYHLIQPYAIEHQVSDHPTQTVERSQLGDLEIDWNEKGVSQYFPAAQCQATDHQDPLRPTVRFRKWDGGIKGVCYNCGESWWEVEPPPIAEPPSDTEQPPSYRYFTPEQKILANQLGISTNNGWKPALQPLHSHIEPPNRRVYVEHEAHPCEKCGQEHAIPYIERFLLSAGHFCLHCGHDEKHASYLKYELERKPDNSILSEFDGYIAFDPLLESESLWTPGGIFHLGAPMGTGKTTLIYQRARESAESGAITIIVVPRISLAKSVHRELRKDTGLGWTVFHEGSERNKPRSERWKIGEYGAIATLGMLPKLLEKLRSQDKKRPIRIFVDEVDFVQSLTLSNIFKGMSKELKAWMRDAKDKIGIVTAGQTALTLALEEIAKELHAPFTGYYLTPRQNTRAAKVFIINSKQVDQPQNRLVQAIIDNIVSILKQGKKCYVLGDERRTAEVITYYFGEMTLVYDKYHRQSPEVEQLHSLKRLPDDKSVFVSTTAVDVGVSIEDENAEMIVFSTTNPLRKGGLSSLIQQCLRNRKKPPLTIYHMKYNNALPLAPTQSIAFQSEHAKQKLNKSEEVPAGLLEQVGIKDAFASLSDSEPESFIQHHLNMAGFDVLTETKDWESVDFEKVKELRKQLRNTEREAVVKRANEILSAHHVLAESEIRSLPWGELQPAPIDQLAHEQTNGLMQIAGWEEEKDAGTPTLNGKPIPDEVWEAVQNANVVDLDIETANKWTQGYLTTHHEEVADAEFEADRNYEVNQRSNHLFIGTLVKTLLSKLPRSPAPQEEIGQALIDAAQTLFAPNRLSALMRDGSVSPDIAKQVRFIDLGKEAQPTEKHFNFVKQFIETYYPCRIAKIGDLYQLAQPKKTELYEAFLLLMGCRVKHKHPDINPEPSQEDLLPPPAADPKADDKKLVIRLRESGASFREIEQEIGVPRQTCCRWISESSRPIQMSHKIPLINNIGNEWDTSASEKSQKTSESRATTVFEADPPKVAKVTSEKVAKVTSTPRHPTIQNQILTMLESGEKRTTDFLCKIEGVNDTAIKNQIKCMVDAGEIVRVRRGVYNLSRPALPSPSQNEQVQSDQILALLDAGEKRTAEIINAVEGHEVSIKKEIKKLVDAGEIVRVRHGVYDLAIRCIGNPVNEIGNEAGNEGEPGHLPLLNQLKVFMEVISIIGAIGELLGTVEGFRKRFYTPPRPVPKWATDLYCALRAKSEP